MSENLRTIKATSEGKKFIDNMIFNRQFVLKKKVTQADCLDLLSAYFKKNAMLYQEMIKEEENGRLSQ